MSATKKKAKISKVLRTAVWYKWATKEQGVIECFACGCWVSSMEFECGHVISEYNGGKTEVDNLRPVHSVCNKSMGKMNLEEFKTVMNKQGVIESNLKMNPQNVSTNADKNQQGEKVQSINNVLPNQRDNTIEFKTENKPKYEFFDKISMEELSNLCEFYGVAKGRTKEIRINNIIASPHFKPDRFIKLNEARKEMMELKLNDLIRLCDEVKVSKYRDSADLVSRILLKNPNIDYKKYSFQPQIERKILLDTKIIEVEKFGMKFKFSSFEHNNDNCAIIMVTLNENVWEKSFRASDLEKLCGFLDTETFDLKIREYLSIANSSSGNFLPKNIKITDDQISITIDNFIGNNTVHILLPRVQKKCSCLCDNCGKRLTQLEEIVLAIKKKYFNDL